jgi:hypothetical protein
MNPVQTFVLSGQVLNGDLLPDDITWVRVYRDGQEIDATSPGADGQFLIELPTGSPVLVRFDHLSTDISRRWHPSVISNLSGSTNQTVVQVLTNKVGFGFRILDELAILNTYSIMLELDAKLHVNSGMRYDLIERYRENLRMLKCTSEARSQHLAHLLERLEQLS